METMEVGAEGDNAPPPAGGNGEVAEGVLADEHNVGAVECDE